MRSQPLISLVLAVKNGLPHIRKTIEALRRQTYRNFELLVQDGGSTDGTLEYLGTVSDLPRIETVSQPDSGVGQAYNRGILRCRGDLVCLIASDEYLDDDALEKGVRWFLQHPDAAVIYGAMRLANADGEIVQVFFPPPFDLTEFLKNALVPTPAASFLNRERLGAALYYDESLRTCPDYDFWIRLGSRFGPDEIICVPDPIVTARGDRVSMSYRVESFDQFCRDKFFVLDRYLDNREDSPENQELRRTASAGILTWAAECVLNLEGIAPAFYRWCAEAAKLDPQSQRLLRLAKSTRAFVIDPVSHQFAVLRVQPERPPPQAESVAGWLLLDEIESLPHWTDARIEHGPTPHVIAAAQPWAYAARIPLHFVNPDEERWYWAKLDVQVLYGQIGVALAVGNGLCNERLVSARNSHVEVFVKINDFAADAILLRNGSLPGPSALAIFDATVEYCPQTSALATPPPAGYPLHIEQLSHQDRVRPGWNRGVNMLYSKLRKWFSPAR